MKHSLLHTIIRVSLGILLFVMLYIGMGCLFQKQFFVPLVSQLFGSRDKEIKQLHETIQIYNKVFTDLYVSDGQVMRLDDLPVRRRKRYASAFLPRRRLASRNHRASLLPRVRRQSDQACGLR